MKTCLLAGIIMFVNLTGIADEGNVLKGAERMKEPSIAKVFPEEYAAYEKALAQANGTNLVRASLVLLAKAKESLHRTSSTTNVAQDEIKIYRATWLLCLQTMHESKNQTAQRLIVDEWNKSLREDDEAVPSQVYTLVEQWNRNLLTDEFWQLLKQTNKKKTISAISYVLCQYGNSADTDRLMQKRKSGIDKASQGIIQNAINWMNYRLSGDKTNPGPAAAPPRME